MKQRNRLGLLLLALGASLVLLFLDSTARVDVATCAPDGFVNTLRERVFTQSVWRGQGLILEGMLARYADADSPAACGSRPPGREQVFCTMEWNEKRRELEACYRAARKLCLAAGAKC